MHNLITVKLLTEAGSLIQAGYPTEAGCRMPPYDAKTS